MTKISKRKKVEVTKEKLDDVIRQIQEWFDANGKDCKAVLGISGGKDSTIAAALLVRALGKDRVFGVLMPNGEQKDINDSIAVVKALDIKSIVVDIKPAFDMVKYGCQAAIGDLSNQTLTNIAPRLRMTTLYAVSQSVNGRVINTSNASETFVGYSTKWGDNVGDFALLSDMTATEVIALGDLMPELPEYLVHKKPADGLSELSDEDKFGYTYAELDAYIEGDMSIREEAKQKIMSDFARTASKRTPIAFVNFQDR